MPWYEDPQWWQAIAEVIAVIFGTISIVKLYSRDYDKEKQIMILTNLAQAQKDSLDEIKLQTASMQQLNELFKNFITNTLSSAANHAAIQKEALELNKQTRIIEIKPRFTSSSINVNWGSGTFDFIIRNIGESASNLSCVLGEDRLIFIKAIQPAQQFILKTHTITLEGGAYNINPTRNTNIYFWIKYADADGREYQQKGTILFATPSVTLSDPEMIIS